MNLVQAKLIAHHTEDGADFVIETVPLGKIYYVDPATLRLEKVQSKHYLTKRTILVERELITVYDRGTGWPLGWFPTELLSFEKNLTGERSEQL